MIAVRPAASRDLDAIAALEAASPGAAGWTRAQFAEELDRPGCLLLAADLDGRLAGYAAARLMLGEAQLLTIAVRPEAARRGVGSSLVADLAQRAKNEGCAKLTLEVSERNAPARRLYERAGARVVGRRPKFYNDGADALLMDITL